MSNTLIKDFLPVYTLVPGKTIARWVPAVEIYTQSWYGYDANGHKHYAHTVLDIDGNNITNIGDEMLYLTGGSPEFGITTIAGKDTQVTTTPGYWSYDVVPDYYTVTYSNNYGWNAASRSIEGLVGDGKAYFSVTIETSGVVCGLNSDLTSSGYHYAEIPYGVYCSHFACVIKKG